MKDKTQTGLERLNERLAARPKYRWSAGLNPHCLDCGQQWYVAAADDPCVFKERQAKGANFLICRWCGADVAVGPHKPTCIVEPGYVSPFDDKGQRK